MLYQLQIICFDSLVIISRGKTIDKRPSPNGLEGGPPIMGSRPLGAMLCCVWPGCPTGPAIPGSDEVTEY